MKSQNLAISIPNYGCNKNCPYCISKMTGYIDSNTDLMFRNVKKVKKYAELAQVNSIMFTSKGEIFTDNNNSQNVMYELMKHFSEFSIEVQTNGKYFLEKSSTYLLKGLYQSGVNTFAISIDTFEDIKKYKDIIKEHPNFIWRATVNLVPDIFKRNFKDNLYKEQSVFYEIKKAGFQQLSFREITIPNFGIVDTEEAKEAVNWIKNNIPNSSSNDLISFKQELFETTRSYPIIRRLPYGAILVDIEGIAVTYFDYCIQDNSSNDDIRSLIFMEDGHLYSSWNSKASIIF